MIEDNKTMVGAIATKGVQKGILIWAISLVDGINGYKHELANFFAECVAEGHYVLLLTDEDARTRIGKRYPITLITLKEDYDDPRNA